MSRAPDERLSGRERQIMDAVYRLGLATAVDIRNAIKDPPSLSTVRTLVRILEEKQCLRHHREGKRYVYSPTVEPESAGRRAIRHLVATFFAGSVSATATALFDASEDKLTIEEAQELAARIDEATRSEET